MITADLSTHIYLMLTFDTFNLQHTFISRIYVYKNYENDTKIDLLVSLMMQTSSDYARSL